MNREKQKAAVPAVGGSSLLVIFTVLCLTVFALLSLSTAQANAKISEASAQAIVDYYQADTQAENILALLRAGEMPEGVVRENGLCRFTCPMGESQELAVTVELLGGRYRVLQWQAQPIGQWTPVEELSVWTGDEGM